jgi:hypothetical protein
MFILIPTCPKYLQISQVSRTLLDRYWPNHPTLEVSLDANDDGWLASVTRARTENPQRREYALQRRVGRAASTHHRMGPHFHDY